MFKSIVVALDRSDASAVALDYATKLAAIDGASMVLVNVLEIAKLAAVSGYQTPYPAEAIEAIRQDGEQLLKEAAEVNAAQKIHVVTIAAEGDPVDVILQAAEEHQCNLIALGTHGRKGLSRLFLGSVAEGVLRRSKVPVFVAPSPHAH